MESPHRKQQHRIDNDMKVSLSTEYAKRIRRHTALLDHSRTSNDSESNSPVYYKKQLVPKDIDAEIVTDSKNDYHCQCTNSNHYFWQEAATMRSFFYGFIFAFICSAILVIRKNR
nr:Bm12800, isoform b [Brugia malayi]